MSICIKQGNSNCSGVKTKIQNPNPKWQLLIYHSQCTIKLLRTTRKTKDVKVKDTYQNPVSIHKSIKYKYSV